MIINWKLDLLRSQRNTHTVNLIEEILFIIRWKFPFTNNTHEPVAYVYWDESITHNAERTNHSASAIDAKEMLYQSWASAWCASATHFTLGLRCLSRNFQLDYDVYCRCHNIKKKTNKQTNKTELICLFQYLCLICEMTLHMMYTCLAELLSGLLFQGLGL